MTKPAACIIMRGAPATGKTTLAKNLSDLLGATYIDGDAIMRKAQNATEEPQEQIDIMLKGMIDTLNDLPKDKNAILDWLTAGKGGIQTLDAVAKIAGKVPFFITLHASLQTCLERNKGRENNVEEDNLADLHKQFSKEDPGMHINTEGKTTEQCADEVIQNFFEMID